MAMPTIRPTIAPIQRDGIYNPAGTLMPIVKIVMTILKTNARKRRARAVYTPVPAAALSIAPLTFV